jgi:hypothetical protein
MRTMSSATELAIRVSVGTGLVLALASCQGGQPDPTVDAAVVDGGAPAICDTPIEGCGCSVEGATAECWPDALVEGGARVCLVGEMTCTGGTWGTCENVHRLEGEDGQDVVIEAASDDPIVCASCEPRCFRAIDTIRSRDVMERGSNGLVFNPAAGNNGAENPGRIIMCSDLSCGTRSSIGAGTGNPWNPTPDNSDGVTVDPGDGALVLGVLGLNSPGVWVANSGNGTISRLDPATGREIGRYVAELPGPTRSGRAPYPSRTAVDQNFDALIANRAFGGQGTLTKIAADLRRCVDRNANGRIDTATDRNMDGRINQADPSEFYGANDECILWTVDVGVPGGTPRSLAIGLAPAGADVGDVWVGNYSEARAYRVRSSDGAVLGSVSTCAGGTCVYSYGAAIDSRGRVFFWGRQGGTRTFGYVTPASSTFTMTASIPFGVGGYGMTYYVNADGSQEYFFNADSDQGIVLRYNVLANNWTYTTTPGRGAPRGMAADVNGNVYAAGWTNGYGWGGSCNNRLWRWDTNLANYQQWTAPTASCFMGVGVTFDNAVWLIGGGNNRGARLAPDRGSWVESPQVFNGPYTYSDFIGYGLNVFANPRGHYSFITDAGDTCDQRWQTLEWSAMAPVGTSVELFVRSSPTSAGLATATWIGPFRTSPANLTLAPGPVPNGRYLEIDIRMETTDRRLTPRVYSAAAAGFCDYTLYDTGGTYTRLYDSTRTEDAATPSTICDPLTERPIWGEFTWDATLPLGTTITLQFRAGRSGAEAAAAMPVTYTITPSSIPPIRSVAELFVMAGRTGEEIQAPFMEARAILNSSADGRRTPTLRSFSLEFTCVDMM